MYKTIIKNPYIILIFIMIVGEALIQFTTVNSPILKSAKAYTNFIDSHVNVYDNDILKYIIHSDLISEQDEVFSFKLPKVTALGLQKNNVYIIAKNGFIENKAFMLKKEN